MGTGVGQENHILQKVIHNIQGVKSELNSSLLVQSKNWKKKRHTCQNVDINLLRSYFVCMTPSGQALVEQM